MRGATILPLALIGLLAIAGLVLALALDDRWHLFAAACLSPGVVVALRTMAMAFKPPRRPTATISIEGAEMPTTQQRPMMASLPAVATMLLGIALLILAALRSRDSGWGALVWLLVMVAMFLIRTPHSLRNRANVVVEARRDRREVALLAGVFLTMMVLPLLHVATGLFGFADYGLPEWATWLGVLAQFPFLWLFWRSHADLGRNWSPGLEVREDHALVTNGVYARIRHPMYAAIWISALAQPLLIHNWIAGFLVIPAFAAMWFVRVPNEEAMMRARFGAVYDGYCRKAGRLFPR